MAALEDDSLWSLDRVQAHASGRGPDVVTAFDRQARLAPAAHAIVDEAGALSYGDLREVANRVAHHLTSLGLERGDPVAVMIDGTRWSVIAALAVLKAKGAYTPVDAAYPPERVAAIFATKRPRLVLVHGSRPATVPAAARVADLAASDAFDRLSCMDPPHDIAPLESAYVIHTSGSTGTPKAIVQTHRCLANFTAWQVAGSGLGRGRRILQCASPSFDVSVQEIFHSLLSGGCLYVTDSRTRRDLPGLARRILADAIEIVDLPFSAINILFGPDALIAEAPALRHLISAGEPLTVTPAIAAFLARNPEVVLHNHYGPAETHMLASHSLRHGDGIEARPPLGRPIPNTHALLCDDRLELVPDGEPGEICIGGDGLARGYLDRAMTAERFVPHPFIAGERLYRSGDVGRWRAGGELEILGRRDDQVKIRGFRVEPAEVEAALRRCPGVTHAAVATRMNGMGARELWGFVDPQAAIRESAIRAFLGARLPDFMLPTRVLAIDRLPLSPNGKVDRKALEAFADACVCEARPDPPASSELPHLIASIWSDVLERPVGPHDDLFLLGCDSLKVAVIAARMTRRLARTVDLRTIFEHPSPEALAHALGDGGRAEPANLPPLVPMDAGAPVLASHGQLGLWIFDQRAGPDRAAYNFVDGFRFPAGSDPAAIERAVAGLVDRHEALRTTLRMENGRLVQIVHARPTGLVETIDLDQADSPEELSRQIARSLVARAPDLERGPATQAVLLCFGAAGAMLLFNVHHAFSDARSSEIVQRDLHRAFSLAQAGLPCALPAPTLHYRDFAAWQHGLVDGAYGRRAAAFWRGLLAGRPGATRLPPDVPSAGGRGHPAGSCRRMLGGALVERLRALSGREGVTLSTWLLVGFSATLAAWTETQDLVFATALAGRDRAELDDQVGLYANLSLVRVQVEARARFADLGRRLRTLVADLRTHAFYPFVHVIDTVAEAAAPGGGPAYEIGFQFIERGRERSAGAPCHAFTLWADRARSPLWVTVDNSADGIAVSAQYSAALYRPETIRALLDAFAARLAALAADPSAPALPEGATAQCA